LLVNGDIYAEFDFSTLRGHALGAMLAHLVLVPNPAQHPRGDFSLSSARVGDEAAPRYTYSGIALVDPDLYTGVRAGEKAPLAPCLYAAAACGRLSGELYEGLWRDIGTVERLAELNSILATRWST
ncbi:MAG: mannose-1-phosphate guanylyltransferase, partial [Betaproteobacteria bacterium]|nr:mannose-1-phosphate guanylyltransferase [Betaproteobacteria bacterium]